MTDSARVLSINWVALPTASRAGLGPSPVCRDQKACEIRGSSPKAREKESIKHMLGFCHAWASADEEDARAVTTAGAAQHVDGRPTDEADATVGNTCVSANTPTGAYTLAANPTSTVLDGSPKFSFASKNNK